MSSLRAPVESLLTGFLQCPRAACNMAGRQGTDLKAAFAPWISQTKPFPPTLQTCQLPFYLLSRRSPCGGDHSSILRLAGSARQFRETTASLRIRYVLEVHGWGPPPHWLERSLKTAILITPERLQDPGQFSFHSRGGLCELCLRTLLPGVTFFFFFFEYMCVILQGFIFPLLSMAVTLKSDHPLFPETLWVSSTLPSANKSKKKKKKGQV